MYHMLEVQGHGKLFLCVIFANTTVPENWFGVRLSQNEINELHDDSRQIFKRIMLDRYVDRPSFSYSGRKCAIFNCFCFAKFSG